MSAWPIGAIPGRQNIFCLNRSPLPIASRYNVSGIRKLIRAALNAEELTTLCYDHFPPVYQEFSGGLTFDRKITLLLDHCQHHDRLSHLLEYLRAANREKFEQYESQIYLDKRGS